MKGKFKVLISLILALFVFEGINYVYAQTPVKKPERPFGTQSTNTTTSKPRQQTISHRQVVSGTNHGHDFVDLGLSVKWATCNLGASKPSDYGNYYAWGETSPKSTYATGNSAWYNSSESALQRLKDRRGRFNTQYDAANQKWGGGLRMPTINEMKELLNRCEWVWTTDDGHNGYRVTGPNGNSIFIPAAGCRSNSEYVCLDSRGDYWSSSIGTDNCAYFLYFTSDAHKWTSNGVDCGKSIRPVIE